MSAAPKSHPDRAAATLAQLLDRGVAADVAGLARPGDGAFDCRIDLKLLLARALPALAASSRAREHLGGLTAAAHPDLHAGTVQDGVARGFAVRLEECIALAGAPSSPTAAPGLGANARTLTGKELRKKKDLLVAGAAARVRFSRKAGLLFVLRDACVNAANCLRFEARSDRGSLDGFAGDPAERARLFSAQFLQPRRYVESELGHELELAGRLGRGPVGWPCELVLRARADEPHVQLQLRVHNQLAGWRLRARFLGVPSEHIEHACTPVREIVANDAGGFVAFTLVRGCTTLLVDGEPIATPAAACLGWLEHHFRLG